MSHLRARMHYTEEWPTPLRVAAAAALKLFNIRVISLSTHNTVYRNRCFAMPFIKWTIEVLDAEPLLLGCMSRGVGVRTHTTHAQLSSFPLSNSCAILCPRLSYHLLTPLLRRVTVYVNTVTLAYKVPYSTLLLRSRLCSRGARAILLL